MSCGSRNLNPTAVALKEIVAIDTLRTCVLLRVDDAHPALVELDVPFSVVDLCLDQRLERLLLRHPADRIFKPYLPVYKTHLFIPKSEAKVGARLSHGYKIFVLMWFDTRRQRQKLGCVLCTSVTYTRVCTVMGTRKSH